MFSNKYVQIASALSMGFLSLKNVIQTKANVNPERIKKTNKNNSDLFPGFVTPKVYAHGRTFSPDQFALTEAFLQFRNDFQKSTGVLLHFLTDYYQHMLSFEDWFVFYDEHRHTPIYSVEFVRSPLPKKCTPVQIAYNDVIPDTRVGQQNNHDFLDFGEYQYGKMAGRMNHTETNFEYTHFLSNIAPMTENLFHDGWAALESMVPYLLQEKGSEACIISGPLYIYDSIYHRHTRCYEKKTPQFTGKKGQVEVPTHFFKIIMLKTEKNERHFYSYLMPNNDFDEFPKPMMHQFTEDRFNKYLCPLEVIEHYLDHKFFGYSPRLFNTISPVGKDYDFPHTPPPRRIIKREVKEKENKECQPQSETQCEPCQSLAEHRTE